MAVAIAKAEELDLDIEAINSRRVGRLVAKMRFQRSRSGEKRAREWIVSKKELEKLARAYGIDENGGVSLQRNGLDGCSDAEHNGRSELNGRPEINGRNDNHGHPDLNGRDDHHGHPDPQGHPDHPDQTGAEDSAPGQGNNPETRSPETEGTETRGPETGSQETWEGDVLKGWL
jgi:hypothetical protein